MNLFGSDMILFVSDMILFGSGFKFQDILVMLVVSLNNFGVKNQVPQVSFKIAAWDLISFHTLGYDMNLFGYDMILFVPSINFQETSVMLVADFINFGVTNQVPQVSKIVAGI